MLYYVILCYIMLYYIIYIIVYILYIIYLYAILSHDQSLWLCMLVASNVPAGRLQWLRTPPALCRAAATFEPGALRVAPGG